MSEEIKLPNGLRYMTDKPPREQLQRLADCVRVQEREALMRETDCTMILREWDAREAELATLRKKLAEAEKAGTTARQAHFEVMGWLVKLARSIGWKLGGDLAKAHELGDALHSKLATAEADCAAMREAISHFVNLTRAGRQTVSVGRSIRATVEELEDGMVWDMPGRQLRALSAALTRPTGQAIMDELSAARKVCELWEPWHHAQTDVMGNGSDGNWKAFDKLNAEVEAALATFDAARKANT